MLATCDQELEASSIPTTMHAQDVHISCPADLVESLVAAFKQQFAALDTVEVYDWGWSCRFRTGYIVLSWKGQVNPDFEDQLDADTRLLGHSIYNLPTESGAIVATNRA